ncbi:hypothetical protein GCM10022287_30870 [Gryllotalpicola koreensis]|uniref:Glycosyl transferase family 1 domain-containing protein n=1 Tax=Gryllotalpicola koreensis TaxID=993086 RepID=A0ABP8A6X0_9MICO
MRPRTVLYEAFAGSGMLDNPEAIFRQLRRDSEFSDLVHCWVIADPALRRRLEAEWRSEASVCFVGYRDWSYWRALATSGYLVNNATFPSEFSKRVGQIYLNTWHGTPLKTMGYDMPDGPRESANTLRNFLAADWLLSQNADMTEVMYRKAYRLDGLFDGGVIEEGYPRTDAQQLDASESAAVRELLTERGVALDGRPILLYAPTWKGTRFSEVADDVAELVATVAQLQARVGESYTVLLKTHQSVFRFARRDPLLRGMLVPNDIPTNTVLAVTELLVTDYSSIQFDYLATGRPMVYYVPDMDAYRGGRGLYLHPSTWPGPLARNADELGDAVAEIAHGRDAWQSARREWSARFAPYDDGAASKRVIDVVFRGQGAGRRVRALEDTRRPRVLMYIGGMRSNGITTSGVTLANALARDGRLDVSVVYGRSESASRIQNAQRLDAEVRQFLRVGAMNAGRLDHRRRGQGPSVELWKDEWRRCFGDARFDHIIDFSGYSTFWAQLLLAGEGKHTIWLHNDLGRDANRTVNGRAHLRDELHGVFELYPRFETLVSVSRELSRINSAALTAHAAREKFTWVPNLIDADAVRASAATPLRSVVERAIADGSADLAAAATRLAAEPDAIWFVSIGRLSPEKNQRRLIHAFAEVAASHPELRLLIVGDGPLRAALEHEAAGRGVGGQVVFSGNSPQPEALLGAADCFVLSSDYEGMPMVLLEAAVLGLAIITTRFGSVNDAVPGAKLTVVEQSEAALAEGMRAFLKGEVARARFDSDAHNRAALDRFVQVLGALPARD